MTAKVTKFTIARLYNLGNYEHKRVEIEVTVPENASACDAFRGVENILDGMQPKCPVQQWEMDGVEGRLKMTNQEWKERYGDGWEEVQKQHIEKFNSLTARRNAWVSANEKARKLLDNLGAAVEFKDAKEAWEDDGDEF